MTIDQTLTISMRSNVAESIKTLGFSVPDFEWTEQPSRLIKANVSRLVYLPNESFFFVFDKNDEGYNVQYSPGFADRVVMNWYKTRKEQLEDVMVWLACLRIEVETEDPWQQFLGSFVLDAASAFSDRDLSPFDEMEKEKVRRSLTGFENLIKEEFEPSSVEQGQIHESLEYLSSALDRLNKFDWKSVLLNTAINMAVALTLSPERGGKLFELLHKAFVQVYLLIPAH